jgi:hypothetical protein
MWLATEFGRRSEPPWWIAGPLVITLLLSIIGLIASLFMMVAERI